MASNSNTPSGANERTETSSLTLNADHLEQLHTLFWQLYNVEIYVGLARAAASEDIDPYTIADEAVELMVKHAHKGIGSMIEGFDNLAESLQVRFTRKGCEFRTLPGNPPDDHLAAACARHGVNVAAMTDAIVEILDTAATRPDSWEGETAQRLVTLAHNLEGVES